MSKQRKDIVIIDLDLPEVNNLEEEIDRITEKLKKANSLADELASKTNPSPKDEQPLEEKLVNLLAGKNIVEVVFGIIIAIEDLGEPQIIARMINAYFNR